jgi:hypothetical protein
MNTPGARAITARAPFAFVGPRPVSCRGVKQKNPFTAALTGGGEGVRERLAPGGQTARLGESTGLTGTAGGACSGVAGGLP